MSAHEDYAGYLLFPDVPAPVVRLDVGGWISGPQTAGGGLMSGGAYLGAEECGARKQAGDAGTGLVWCCLDPCHVDRGELHESADYEWDDLMTFAVWKGSR